MAGIWNISGSTNVEQKKITGKLSFDIGDVFMAKIIDKNDSGQMVEIKTADGWKFQARLDKPLEQLPDGLVRFQVQGMENGVLTLRLSEKPDSNSRKIEQDIENILKELNIDFTKDDLSLFMKMIKFNMPLTKENIAEIKSLIDFQGKIKENGEEEQSFIQKYLSKNNIDPDSEEGQNAEATLKDFFTALKSLSHEDILTLRENGIELTKDNIDSFKRIMDNNNVIYDDVKELSSSIEKQSEDYSGKGSEPVNNTAIKNIISLMENNGEKLSEDISVNIKDIVSSFIENKYNQSLNPAENKNPGEKNVSLNSDFISRISEKIDNIVSDLVDKNMEELKADLIIKTTASSESAADSDTLSAPEQFSEPEQITRTMENPEQIASAAATAAVQESSGITESEEITEPSEILKSINTFTQNLKADMIKELSSISEGISQEIPVKTDNSPAAKAEKIIMLSSTLADRISDSIDKSVNNYLMKPDNAAHIKQDVPRNILIRSYIEDLLNKAFNNVKEFDKSDAVIADKFTGLKNGILNKVHNFLEFSYLIRDKDDASEEIAAAGEKLKNNIGETAEKEMGSVQLKDSIENIIDELIKNITDTIDDSRQDDPGIIKNTRESIENVKKEFIEKNRELITDIKDFIQQKSGLKPEQYNKIVEQMRSNINDFRVYNSLSNNYYLLDLPINVSDKQYDCRLMIKDDRKNGKKIDSRDVKFVVSVGTLNMGTIDAFINVKNDNLKIDVKSESKWIRLLNSGRNKLVESLKIMGYNVYLTFSESKTPADLPECREFFNDFSLSILDTKV